MVSAEEIEQFLNKESDEAAIAEIIASDLGIVLPEIEIHDFRVNGYLPAALTNYIALLGWSPPGGEERFDLNFLTRTFDLSRVSKSNARFDRDKLRAFNAEAIAKLPPQDFTDLLRQRDELRGSRFTQRLGPHVSLFASAYQSRSQTLEDPFTLGRFFALDPLEIEYNAKAVQNVLLAKDGAGLKALAEVRAVLEACEPFDPPTLHAALEHFATQTQRKIGDVAQPLRVAVTGSTVSPPIDQTLAILGKPAVLARIDVALARHSTKGNP